MVLEMAKRLVPTDRPNHSYAHIQALCIYDFLEFFLHSLPQQMFTLYSADYINSPGNCSYPHKIIVTDETTLAAAVSHDYVCAEYMNSYRNGDNFLGSDCLPVDCDNDHSENPADWVTPADVQAAFPGISFAVHYSRFHMREKNGKPARPKFHVLFPIEYMTDAAAYSEMKKLVNTIFPYFDTKALDAARFFFGTATPEVEMYPGEMTLSEYLSADDFDADLPGGSHGGTQVIPEGSRNATMSRFAGRVIKKYGDCEEAFNCFMEEADKCTPPLEQQELMTIWHSAQKFYAKVQQQDGYVPPELYNDDTSYKPDDFSDVGQAEVLAKHFSGELRYSPATHYIRYNGRYWQETEPGAQAVAHELTRRQMKEASNDMLSALASLKACGAQEILENNSKAKAESMMNDEQLEAYKAFLAAKAYQSYDVWERQGTLQTTEGNVVHYGYIEKFIERLGERFNIREIAFDRWGAVQMVQNLEGMGFTVVPFGQGFKDMSPPTKELMKLVLEEKIAHGGHPVLRWMMDNIFIRTDPAGNIKPDKEKSTEKIDGAVATIMALDRAIRCGNDTGASVYDDRGILFI